MSSARSGLEMNVEMEEHRGRPRIHARWKKRSSRCVSDSVRRGSNAASGRDPAPSNLACAQFQQLADVGGGHERVAQRLAVAIEWRRGDKLAMDLGEQEGALRQHSAVERGQAFECNMVIVSAVTDQDRAG
jgi:hypothetical protein